VDGARTGINLVRGVPRWLSLKQSSEGAPSKEKSITDFSSVTTVGLDLAKLIFQVHGVGRHRDHYRARRKPISYRHPRDAGPHSIPAMSPRPLLQAPGDVHSVSNK
jgi:hypothetical protein